MYSYHGIYLMLTLLDKSSCGRPFVACFSLLDSPETSVRIESWRGKRRDITAPGFSSQPLLQSPVLNFTKRSLQLPGQPEQLPEPCHLHFLRHPSPARPARLCTVAGLPSASALGKTAAQKVTVMHTV